MGYRYYIGSISNQRLKKIKNLENYKDLYEVLELNRKVVDDYQVGVYDINEIVLQELGTEADYINKIEKKEKKPIFTNKEFNKQITSGYDLFLINKEILIFIINSLNEIVKKYYQKKWALSIFLQVLLAKDIEEIKCFEKEFIKACEYIFSKEYNRYKYDLTDLNVQIEDLLNKNFETIKFKYIKYISQELLTYFNEELFDYNNDFKFYNLNENQPFAINNSWKINKSILELTHILKTFNFKKNKMLIFAY